MLTFPDRLPLYVWPFGNGAMCALIMAGVVTSAVFISVEEPRIRRNPVLFGLGVALLMQAAGRVLTPFGISKIRATPTWTLYSAGAAVLAFTLLYWLCDVKHKTRWAFPVRAAGSNTLTTYLLPDLWYFLLGATGLTYLDTHFTEGWPGVAKTVVFTLVMLALASLLTKLKVRLRL